MGLVVVIAFVIGIGVILSRSGWWKQSENRSANDDANFGTFIDTTSHQHHHHHHHHADNSHHSHNDHGGFDGGGGGHHG